MKQIKKRITAIILAMAMLFILIPVLSASAVPNEYVPTTFRKLATFHLQITIDVKKTDPDDPMYYRAHMSMPWQYGTTVIEEGDYLEYDVYFETGKPGPGWGGVDFTGFDAYALGVLDTNGIPLENGNLTYWAHNKWYHRVIDLSPAAGRDLGWFSVSYIPDIEASGMVKYANVKLVNADGKDKNAFFTGTIEWHMYENSTANEWRSGNKLKTNLYPYVANGFNGENDEWVTVTPPSNHSFSHPNKIFKNIEIKTERANIRMDYYPLTEEDKELPIYEPNPGDTSWKEMLPPDPIPPSRGLVPPAPPPVVEPEESGDPLEGASEWAIPEITNAIEKGLVPENLQKNYQSNVTRGEVAQMFINLIEIASGMNIDAFMETKGVTIDSNAFDDTDDKAVFAANALGIINGTGDGKFSPDGFLQRAQIAAIINRVARVMGIETDGYTHSFTDVAGHWVDAELGWPVHAEIVKGVSATEFNPAGALTTEQAIAITYRSLAPLSAQ